MRTLFLLAAAVLAGRRWGASRCDCDALRRRLAVAHRETRDFRGIAIGAMSEVIRLREGENE